MNGTGKKAFNIQFNVQRSVQCHADHRNTLSPQRGEGRVRGEKAKRCEFPKVRLVESSDLQRESKGKSKSKSKKRPDSAYRDGRRFMGSFHLHVMCTRIGAMNIRLKRALTPSPFPIRPWLRRRLRRGEWERVAARPGEGLFMGRTDLQLLDAHWAHEPNPISRSSRGNEALIFFPEDALGQSEPPDVGCYLRVGSWRASTCT